MGVAVLAGCGGSAPGYGVQRTDSAGIEVVTYQGSDRPLDWRFEAVLSLGGKETDEEAFYQLAESSVGGDTRGNIYVLDRTARRVVVFDSGGTFLRAMGREGGGPGELRFPIALAVSPSGVASVLDLGKWALVRFGPDGAVLEQVRAELQYGGGRMYDRDGVLLFGLQEFDGSQGRFTDRLLQVTEADTLEVVRLERPAGTSITLESCGMRLAGMAPVFAARLRWTALDELVAVSTSPAYEVAFYVGEVPVRLMRHKVEPVPATTKAAVLRIGEGMRVQTPGGVRVCDPQEVVEQRGVADVIPAIGEMAAGPGGTLWIRRDAGPERPAPIDLFDRDAGYLGTLPEGSPFPVLVLGDRLAAIETDELDVDRLVVYRVDRPRIDR